MATLTVGTVVLVPFPFSDLSASKLRPAVVLSDAGRGDFILCQITSNAYGDPRSILISNSAFRTGSLRIDSYARPGKLFTANDKLVVKTIGELKKDFFYHLIEAVISLIDSSRR
jgi:mRNA interferase MazF